MLVDVTAPYNRAHRELSLSPLVNHIDTSQSWVSVSSCNVKEGS